MAEPPPAYDEAGVGYKGGVYPGGGPQQHNMYPQQNVYPQMPPMPNEIPDYGQQPTIMIQQPMPGAPRSGVQQVFVGALAFSADPQDMMCPYCQTQIVTKTNTKAGLLTYLLCGGLAFFGCWICCCIPFCVDSAQDVEHTCPRCNRFLGTYKRI